MNRRGPAPLTVLSALGAMIVASSSPHATASDGLALYLRGHDPEALAALSAQGPDLSRLGRLALADLHLLHGRPRAARRALAPLLFQEDPPTDIQIWLAWTDFVAGSLVEATSRLTRLRSSGTPASTAVRAAFSLGWQQLLTGQPAEAARTFARLSLADSSSDPALPDMDAQVSLLLGQALIWSGRCDEAEAPLRAVAAEGLRADAARDLAWCHHLRGDTERARDELEEIAAAGDSGRSRLVAPWPAVMRRGPGRLGRAWLPAYRRRPRAQDPMVFLSECADRDAAADARALLASIERSLEPSSSGLEHPGHVAGGAHRQVAAPDVDHATGHGVPAAPPASAPRSRPLGAVVLGVALFLGLLLILAARRHRDRRRRAF